ncbi:MAG: arylesterase [Cyclobacteriaceae bacterium]
MLRQSIFPAIALCLLLACQQQKTIGGETISLADTLDQKDETASSIILFFGNSLTAGYGLDSLEAFPELIGRRLDSLSLNYKVVNAGLSGETTASGRNRIDWVLQQEVSILVLELGANDGLRGIDPSETKENLGAIIDIFHEKNPKGKVLLAGMEVPPNMGPDYAAKFRVIFKDLAVEYDIALVPFLLKGVGGEEKLNQADGIHPTGEGHQILADNVWLVLHDML